MELGRINIVFFHYIFRKLLNLLGKLNKLTQFKSKQTNKTHLTNRKIFRTPIWLKKKSTNQTTIYKFVLSFIAACSTFLNEVSVLVIRSTERLKSIN